MSWLAAFYRAYSRLSLAIELQYRIALLIWQIGAVLEPTVFLVVWSAAARGNGGAVGGYTPADFAAYYLALLVVNRLTSTYVMWIFEGRIREGLFSAMLLRPIHPIHADIAEQTTHNAIAFITLVPVIGALWLFFQPALAPPPWAALAFAPALALAFALRFLVEWCLSLSAFWTTRTTAVNQLYFVALFFFSGISAPLSLFPGWVQAVAALLPFRAMVAFPIELLLGRLDPATAALGFATQLVWIAVAYGFFAVLWRAGIRRYAGVGA
jgi:ABC-2 type transport system permease protein